MAGMHFDSKDKNHASPPRLWATAGQRTLSEARGRGLPGCAAESPGPLADVFPSILSCSLVFLCEPCGHPFARKGFRETQAPSHTSDFYPRFVIKNMFRDLIICIFPFRVNPLKGSLIPCSTVLTKCFHIFSS